MTCFVRLTALSMLVALALLIPSVRDAQAQSQCEINPTLKGCAGAQPSTAAGASIRRQIIRPDNLVSLNPKGLYLVNVVCTDKKDALPLETARGFVSNNIAAAELFAITSQNNATFPAPADAKAEIAAYVIGGPADNRTGYINRACSTSFFITPRSKLYLIASSSKVSTLTAGATLTAIQSALSVISAIAPIFSGYAIPDQAGRRAMAVDDSKAPISAFLAAFNTGLTTIEASELYEGKQRIDADYATISIDVTPLHSITGLQNANFTTALEDGFAALFKPSTITVTNNSTIESTCEAIAGPLKNQFNLPRIDIAYVLSYIARNSAITNSTQMIHCLGKEYALAVTAKGYQDDWDDRHKFSSDFVSTVFPDNDATPPQPDFKQAKAQLQRLIRAMGAYKNIEPQKTELAAKATSPLKVNDESNTLNAAEEKVNITDFMDQMKEKGFTRFGCLLPDTDSPAAFLALPTAPASGEKYLLNEVLVVSVWFNKQQATKFLITSDGDVAGAAVNKNNGSCGRGTAQFEKFSGN